MGVKLPVTLLAKWKTTLQLVALGAELLVASWYAWGLSDDPMVLGWATTVAHSLLWLAAIITLWTGWQYWTAARQAMKPV